MKIGKGILTCVKCGEIYGTSNGTRCPRCGTDNQLTQTLKYIGKSETGGSVFAVGKADEGMWKVMRIRNGQKEMVDDGLTKDEAIHLRTRLGKEDPESSDRIVIERDVTHRGYYER